MAPKAVPTAQSRTILPVVLLFPCEIKREFLENRRAPAEVKDDRTGALTAPKPPSWRNSKGLLYAPVSMSRQSRGPKAQPKENEK